MKQKINETILDENMFSQLRDQALVLLNKAKSYLGNEITYRRRNESEIIKSKAIRINVYDDDTRGQIYLVTENGESIHIAQVIKIIAQYSLADPAEQGQ